MAARLTDLDNAAAHAGRGQDAQEIISDLLVYYVANHQELIQVKV
jgi:hypothetical protein